MLGKLLSYIYSEEFIKKILSYWSEKNWDIGIGFENTPT